MKPLMIHTVHDCAEPVASTLRATQSSLGFIPNLFGVLAESAPALAAFAALNSQFARTSFSPTERELIALTVSTDNHCSYCVAGHSAFAAMQAVDEGVVQALRDGQPIPDPRLESLRRFTLSLLRSRGMVSSTEIKQFLDAGYTQQQLLEVILGITVKVMSNLTNNAIRIPLDEVFAPYAWQAPRTPIPMPTTQPKAA
jgi:uncharacterized peroxidase-related enzyme